MKIKRVSITGMHKVLSKTYDLRDDVTYFVGDNGAGKSTILEAIQLGLLGYIPGYAKTNEAIMKHASGPSMTVSLLLDSDISITRTWTRSGASVKSTLSTTNYDEKKIGELISDIELPIFNFNEFKSMTANKLKEWFISFLPSVADELNVEDELRKAASERAIPVDDLVKEALNRVSHSGLKGVDMVKDLNAWVKEYQSFTKGQIAKQQATIESLIHYDDAPDGDEDEICKQIADLNALLIDLSKYQSELTIYNRSMESVKDLKESLPADCFANDSRIADMEAKVKAIQAELDASQTELMTLQGEKSKLLADRENLRIEHAKLSSASTDTCPYTKSRCETLSAMIKENADKAKELSDKLTELNNHIAEIDGKIASAPKSSTKLSEKQQILSNIEFIRGQYGKLAALEEQIVEPRAIPTGRTVEDINAEVSKLNNDLAMIKANKRFDELTEQVTKDKFQMENNLEILKLWDKLTGANGLQTTLMDTPFQNLASEMSNYLTNMFGKETTAQFNLSTKANSFSFGLTRDGSYIEFDYLSSGERCLFTLALIMCILNKSKSQVRTILIDDILDHLDESNASYLFKTIKDIKDIQFIMAGVKECSDTTICEKV